MKRGELLYRGSVKLVYAVTGDPARVVFEFTDRISVFDKWIPNVVPAKGEVLCRVASFWFRRLAEAGFRTHFVEQLGPTTMLVDRIEVEHDYARITPGRRGVLVPLELIVRHFAAGSFFDRMEKGTLAGVPPGTFAYGERLPAPFCETSTKVEATDRLIGRAEALRISALSGAELDAIWKTCLDVDVLIEAQVALGGLVHADGKKEFGRAADGELMLVDVLGTPDEDRWWDADALAAGEVRQHSKEMVRDHYRKIGYKDALYAARAAGEPEPEIPPMPAALVAQTSALYVSLFERITGESFR